MHLLFMDESGTPPNPAQSRPAYFVVGGVIIPEALWPQIRDLYFGMKVRRKLRGELKWRFFAPTNSDPKNPMRSLSQAERDEIRLEIYSILTAHRGVRTLASVVSCEAAYAMHSVNSQDDIYHLAYKTLTERFQYYLQDIGRTTGTKQYGIVVADHRGANDDRMLRQVHQKLLYAKGEFISSYQNLIEGLFLTPSHTSVGVQLADLVAGAVWRRFERNDGRWFDAIEGTFRRGPNNQIDGYGLIKAPKEGWR